MSTESPWLAPRGSLELKTGYIHLWRVDLDRSLHVLPDLEQTLSSAERRSAGAFRKPAHCGYYSLTRGAVRTIRGGLCRACNDFVRKQRTTEYLSLHAVLPQNGENHVRASVSGV